MKVRVIDATIDGEYSPELFARAVDDLERGGVPRRHLDPFGVRHTCEARARDLERIDPHGYEPGKPAYACGCAPREHVFLCSVCGERCGWCYGAADDMPDACDSCWAKAHAGDDA